MFCSAAHTQVASELFQNHQEYKRGLERKLAALTPAGASDHSANGTFLFASAVNIYLWPAFVLHPLAQGFVLILTSFAFVSPGLFPWQ
jgi:hypothetical protein